MKKFLSGVLCATLVFSLALSALAISGNVSFNLSAIKFDGQVISKAGEGYTLSNGCVAPASITYTDEKGGGTTYLPVRRIGELAGVTIDWDGAVVVKTPEFAEQEKREAERAAALDYSFDYSYEEFKGLWTDTEVSHTIHVFFPIDPDKTIAWWNNAPDNLAEDYALALLHEYPDIVRGDFGGKHGELLYSYTAD